MNRWDTSSRRSRLPADWTRRRANVLRRDRTCTCYGCPRCTSTTPNPCQAASTEVDHIVPTDDHTYLNLRGVCTPCHRHKTAAEGHTAMRIRQAAAKHPTETHPGLT